MNLLDRNVSKKIAKEVGLATQHLQDSPMDDDNDGGGRGGKVPNVIINQLDNKLDKIDFDIEMK